MVKEQLSVATDGYELLEQKREILVMELMRMVEKVKLLERDIEKQIPVALENSSLLRVLGAEALSGASRAWLRGNDFVTIERPDMGSIGNVAMDAVLELFKDTTPETVVEDVRALTPVLSAAVAVTKLQAAV